MNASKVTVDEAYDSPPFWYDVRGLGILWLTYKSSLRRQIQFFSQFDKSGNHLEVAIGSGSLFEIIYYWSKLKKCLPKRIVGFDYAPSMLAGAQKKFSNKKEIELQIVDATQMPYEDNHFDSVHLANAVHCIPDYPKALAEIFRVMKPNSQFLVNVLLPPTGFLRKISDRINKWGIKKGILQAPIEEAEFLKNLENCGFILAKSFKEGNCLYVIARKMT